MASNITGQQNETPIHQPTIALVKATGCVVWELYSCMVFSNAFLANCKPVFQLLPTGLTVAVSPTSPAPTVTHPLNDRARSALERLIINGTGHGRVGIMRQGVSNFWYHTYLAWVESGQPRPTIGTIGQGKVNPGTPGTNLPP